MFIDIFHSMPSSDIIIMIVDDDEDILAITEMALNQWGYHNVDIFSDPDRALEQFQSNAIGGKDDLYKLVVTDVRMPNMDGMSLALELLKIRKDEMIVFMSAFEMDKDTLTVPMQFPRSLAERKYLQKPFP